VPLPGAINAWANRNRLMILTGVFDIQLVPVSDAAQFSALGEGQEYRLLLQPVPMPSISTGYNMSWYF